MSGVYWHARRLERRYVHALAPEAFEQKTQGSAIAREAFRQPDLLPIFGSSELLVTRRYAKPFEAGSLFRDYPTGFNVFPIAKLQNGCLLILQKLSALGGEARGRKVVISLSPGWFFERVKADAESYAGNFSPLHASELAFGGGLSLELRSAAARRMLDYPGTLGRRPLTRFALEQLAAGGAWRTGLYWACLPLGWVQTLVLRLQDHWEMLALLRQRTDLDPDPPRLAATLDWPALLDEAEADYAAHSASNPFGIDDQTWRLNFEGRPDALGDDARFWLRKRLLHDGGEWTDLDLLLRGLRELGAHALLVSLPINGAYFESHDLDRAARKVYYDRVRAAAARQAIASFDFEDHDTDSHFGMDPWAHLSPKGWVFYDRALDDFYHGRL